MGYIPVGVERYMWLSMTPLDQMGPPITSTIYFYNIYTQTHNVMHLATLIIDTIMKF